MDSRAKEVVKIGDKAFSDKRSVDALHQEFALNFYPKRATFTSKRDDGDEYSDHLFSSYPVLARRELGNMLDEYLFPDKFFSIHVDDESLDEGDEERRFLDRLTEIQWRAMTDPVAGLITARGQGNHDLATFGNAVIRFSLNIDRDALLFRCYHLRDNAWGENGEGIQDINHRNWDPTARQLVHHFRGKVSDEVKKAFDKDPDKTFACRHVVLPSRIYDEKKKGKRFAFTSFYVECESQTVLEEVGQTQFGYVIPRWQQVSGSVWGTSMATDVLLPDGRTLQVVMRTLREAGEMHVNPPMVGVTEFIRSDIALYPGGITTADAEYDSKIGDVLRPITRDKGGFPIGSEIAEALKQDIRAGFFLDKIQLPETTHDMTATEVRRRIQEHIRAAAPISKPIQAVYNNPLCDGVFNLLLENKAFPIDEMPESLVNRQIKFKFRSPIDELVEQNEAALYIENRDTILIPAIQIDPSIAAEIDFRQATKDALRANGWKAKWNKPKEQVEAEQAQMAEQAEEQKLAEQLAMAGQIAEQGGKGMDAIGKGVGSIATAGQPKPAARPAPNGRPRAA